MVVFNIFDEPYNEYVLVVWLRGVVRKLRYAALCSAGSVRGVDVLRCGSCDDRGTFVIVVRMGVMMVFVKSDRCVVVVLVCFIK
jgi:hypothetical protein